uniref:Zinc finger, CCHC-type n=1 Tax=Tanacetum cinerariifolium TaxID=118510 RepID=A0A6L2LHJ5_TANCI|nr:zinc finger, CCHC-type [Tanacetum cinerariifolium]
MEYEFVALAAAERNVLWTKAHVIQSSQECAWNLLKRRMKNLLLMEEALDKFKVFKTEVKLQQGAMIKEFRTDKGVLRPSHRSLVNRTKDIGALVVPKKVTKEVLVQQPEPELRKSKRNRTSKNFGPEFQLYLIEGTKDEDSNQHSYCFNVEDDPKIFDEAMKPAIAFIVGKLSRYTSNLSTQHWQAIQRVLKYLKKTMDYSLTYTGYPLVLEGYTDASKKQTCIISSTMEYEFVALAAAGKEVEWLRNLILEISLWSKPIAPISIHCDSAATLAKAYS